MSSLVETTTVARAGSGDPRQIFLPGDLNFLPLSIGDNFRQRLFAPPPSKCEKRNECDGKVSQIILKNQRSEMSFGMSPARSGKPRIYWAVSEILPFVNFGYFGGFTNIINGLN